jgi:hypothetical protein
MGEWRYNSTIIYLNTRWRRVVSFTLQPLYPEGKYPGTHYIGGWVEPIAGLDAAEKRKAKNKTPTIQHVARPYTD